MQSGLWDFLYLASVFFDVVMWSQS